MVILLMDLNHGKYLIRIKLLLLKVNLRTEKEGFFPYLRDDNLSRPWAVPGTPGLEHRIGGLEKANITGKCKL
jgi:hypothetical protein